MFEILYSSFGTKNYIVSINGSMKVLKGCNYKLEVCLGQQIEEEECNKQQNDRR